MRENSLLKAMCILKSTPHKNKCIFDADATNGGFKGFINDEILEIAVFSLKKYFYIL